MMVPTIQFLIVTTTILTTATTTSLHAHTLIQLLDYIFYGIYTINVLVLKRFIPSEALVLIA